MKPELIEARNALAKATHAALDLHGVAWEARDVAPETFEEARASYAERGRVVVWNGASDNTVYAKPRDNWAARAWHDFHHIRGGYKFTLEGERATCEAQGVDLEILHAAGVLDQNEAADAWRLLRLEVIGQAEHFAEHGEFPADQVAFTNERF